MRYFLAKNGSIVVEKKCYAGDDSTTTGLVAQYLAAHPSFTALEVDQATFDATPFVPDPLTTRNDALNALATGASGEDKLMRAILLVIIDEINTIRTQLSLASRTVNQLKTAVQAKINAGTAD